MTSGGGKSFILTWTLAVALAHICLAPYSAVPAQAETDPTDNRKRGKKGT